jgi:hypothetical protein
MHTYISTSFYVFLVAIFIAFHASLASAADPITIFAAPLPPNWPTTMTVIVPETLKLNAPTFAWSFPTDSGNPSCTTDGKKNVSPCNGRVVDHTFPAGTHTLKVVITDSTLFYSYHRHTFHSNQTNFRIYRCHSSGDPLRPYGRLD